MAKVNKHSPFGAESLEEAALSYVARYATTQAKLERYLSRKLRERGWGEEGEPPVGAIAGRMVEAGYVDDAAFAQARSGSLLRRGYGARRIDQALFQAGVGEAVSQDVAPGEGEARRAALILARRRGFGPFGREPLDEKRREKQIAAMLRAGHSFAAARAIIDAGDVTRAEAWVAEAEDEI